MDNILQSISSQFPYYILVFIRVTGLFLITPIFGRKNVPAKLKIGFSVILTYIFIQVFPPETVVEMDSVLVYAASCIKELIIGLILAYITVLFFSITLTAGHMIDVQMGIGLSSVFDPQTGSQVSSTGALLNLLMLLYFFSFNGHHMLLKIMYLTFKKIPVGNFQINLTFINVIIETFILTFALSLSLMMPIIATALLIELGLGMICRTVPQMNAFIVGIPLKILLGFIVLLLMQPFYVEFCSGVFERMYDSVNMVFEELITNP